MMHVMFVDDEPNILNGIRRMLRSMRSTWDLKFAESGNAALEEFEQQVCDVIVCDMRMPGMDGAMLLAAVREKYPGTIRIALSGETDQSMIYRCVQHAHQYLSKPCDAETLVETIRRAARLQNLLQDDDLAARISELSSIPSLPEQYQQMMEELQSEDASLNKIGEIVETDVAMTAKILQLANSAFFGITTHISSPAQATTLLGVDVIRALVITAGVFSQFDENADSCYDLGAIWSRSAQVGALAKKIAMAETHNKVTADYALMGGMLIDIGQLVIAANVKDEKADTLRAGLKSGTADWELERAIIGQTHMEIGAYLIGLWGLPNPIVECIAYHHSPADYGSAEFSALAAVHAALAIVSDDGSGRLESLDRDYIESLGRIDQVVEWQRIHSDFAETA